MTEFIPGLVLAERFYREAVRPLLAPGLPHAAALLGPGSEVLGFDTPVSTDHHWGPRVQLFLDDDAHAEAIRALLRRELPHVFLGWPTSFTEPNPADHGVQTLQRTTSGPVNHRVDVLSLRAFFAGYLGHPALIAGRLVRDVMRLCFLMERVYAPYPKWYGTAFARLDAAGRVGPLLQQTLRAATWQERDRVLGEAYGVLAEMQNALDLADPQPAEATRFFDRPFSVIFGERFATALMARIENPGLRRLPLIGSVDQWSDSPDVLQTTALRSRLAALYRAD